jgi:hypothetical protein
MTTSTPIDAELAAFLQSGVSMSVATRDATLQPSLARAVGCRVDGDTVTLLLPAPRAAQVLADIAANGMIAAVFSRPTTHRTVQLKGSDARIVPVAAADAQLLADYRAAFLRELAVVGHTERPFDAILVHEPSELAAVAFTPTAAYTQTPGPRAGEPLERGA